MLGNKQKRFGKLAQLVFIGAAFLAVSLWASPDTAFADQKRSRGRGTVVHKDHRAPKNKRFYGERGRKFHGKRWNGRRPVVPPRQMNRHQVRTYQRYYSGRTYFRPHRHQHQVYYFPVATPYGYYEYRPHFYCGDRLFVGGEFGSHGTHIGFSISF